MFRIRIRIRRIRMFLGLPGPHPNPLERGTDPRIRIRIWLRTKMSRIHNTALNPEKGKLMQANETDVLLLLICLNQIDYGLTCCIS